MTRIIRAFALLSLIALGCGAPPAPAPTLAVTSTPLAPRIARVEHAVDAEARALGAPGLSVTVVDEGAIVWAGGWGVADVESGAEATSQTIYRVASISKPIAATLMVRLAARGALDLDAPIGAHVDGLPDHIAPLTTRQILSHTTGMRHYDYPAGEKENRAVFATVDEAIRIYGVLDEPLRFAPGAGYLYSTYAYNLLAALVPAVTGRSFAEAARVEIFEPAAMSTAHMAAPGLTVPDRARQYRRGDDGAITPAPPVDLSWKLPGGGVLASVTDLARYVIALDAGTLVDPADDARLGTYRPVTLPDGTSTGYGLGWHVKADPDGRRWVGHGGGATGGAAYVFRRPAQRFAVVVLTNLEVRSARLQAIARRVEAAWRGRSPPN